MNSKQPVYSLSSSSLTVFLFSSFFTFLTTDIVFGLHGGNDSDHMALLSFKSMITEDPYGALSSWNTSFHFCNWSGVSCGKRHKRVTRILLRSLGLKGSVSPYVGNLSYLRVISLRNNSFQGIIPHELGRLFRLRQLEFTQNNFNGVIPINLSNCSNLEGLWLEENMLVGSIPKEISLLSKLILFTIDNNNLTGGIPPFLGNMTSLEVLSVPGNQFGGTTIPDIFGHLKSLRELYFGSCNFYGTIPGSIYNLSLLTQFSLAENQLSGNLLPEIGSMLPHLEFLQLRDNQLTGVLPPSLSNCSNLTVIEMGDNYFIGKLTIDFAKLGNISQILIGGNLFGNEKADEMEFIDSLKNCSRLEALILSDCKFQGILPSSIGNLSNHVSLLALDGNMLHGNLPSSIGNIVGLTALDLADNQFTGNIPSTIGMLQKLQLVALYNNQFTGKIPDAIGNLSSLITLLLYTNKLEGHIPSSLGKCHHLTNLVLRDNKLTGRIPKQILQLSSLSIKLDLSQNNLVGSLPSEVGELKMLTYLDLSNNNLSSNIPSTLGSCTSLLGLSLKENSFQGKIPPSLSSLRGVEELDLSHNMFTGQIPPFLEGFLLESLDLSFNEFEGEVPMRGVFANASAFSVVENSRLCGGVVELGLPKCKNIAKHKKTFPLFVIIILIATTIFFILCFLYVWSKKKSKSQLSQSSMTERFLKVSYNQLLKATDGFSNANLIGKGGFSSVYKGILDFYDDKFVAIKVVHLQNRGAHKSFLVECDVWRSIRHRNLLKIITSCSSVDFQGNDFKALVYEFMPNGSLHAWLHSRASTSELNLLQRLNILTDVASALDYLHNHCLVTIVHGDLKPSNILLDDDMVAHVGDFGLAQFLGTNSTKNSSTGIKGTIGYAPPEYGLGGAMTTNGDVYSFGILLLEMMTGKNPTDDIFNEGLNLHKFAYEALPGHVTNVIDGELLNVHQKDAIGIQSQVAIAKKVNECMASVVEIGVSCSMESPQHRMSIENALQLLRRIQYTLQSS